MDPQGREPVLVVPLAEGTPSWSSISWRDIVNKRRCYFHPIGGRKFPAMSVTCLGFRYNGRLQSAHRVEEVAVIKCRSELELHIPEIDGDACRRAYDGGVPTPHFLYTLGPPILPDHVVRNGRRVIMARKLWADLDLLLSSQTISEAEQRTNARKVGSDVSAHDDRSGPISATSFVLPPIADAASLIERIRHLAGLPERNHEDVVRDLLVRLGHPPSSIVFQRGRIDVSVSNGAGLQLIFEVKRSIDDAPQRDAALRQAHDYAGRTGVELFVVSDGDRYAIYDRRKGRSYDQMLCGDFRLTAFYDNDSKALDLLRPETK